MIVEKLKSAIKAADDCAPSLEFASGLNSLLSMSFETIPAAQLPSLLAEGHTVIDVRSPSEYRAEHVQGAELNPLDTLDAEDFCTHNDPGFPVYILCKSGKRASMAAEKLVTAGHQSIFVVEGGTDAAKTAGVEIEYGQGSISIERQVRIAAGSLVVLGVVLGLTVHSGFLGISAFVGAGLVFAGITDTCGMGLMLAKMPWNR